MTREAADGGKAAVGAPADGSARSAALAGRALLLRLGMPRDPAAPRHLAAFLVATVATVLLTRGALAATGYPQVGGATLHIAHVLWGGLLLAVAVVLLLSYAGPVVRPVGALLGGIGFGLFVDEIGKFVTADNDYFYEPTASLIYVVVVLLVLLAEALHGRRERDPVELLAGAVDHAVSGVTGGFSPRARRQARALVRAAGDQRGTAEVRALLRVVEDDHEELPDITGAVARWVVRCTYRLVRERWVPWAAVVVLTGAGVATVGRGMVAWLQGADVPGWVVTGMLLSGAGSLACAVVGLVVVRRSRESGFAWFRRAVLVSLLLTQIFLFRLDQWAAVTGLVVDLVVLAVVAAEAEVARSRRTEGEGASTTT
ncbi:hypothetical protein [Cellulomonas chengniuliangii]|uniref:Uncharacterized protein n=1 Tax=Cellulomonas chengniuliangii TaxID=2968084 RepID=A0ABY5L200_9CELL|nr:hypothetical protein [Cellulomonas chengniuliangii]MCC2308285.1 hypothetical protein [Cellulomonas chengniuliangii]UUI76669.1 hypothetical protein NP064_07255 [Cellulomonas chengniuliangii]